MKKNILSLIAVFLVSSSLFISCTDDDESILGTQYTVVVSGTLKAELDLTNTGQELVPDGTIIIATIESQNLVQNPIPGYDYQTLQFEAETIGGAYSIELPSAIFAGVPITLTPVSFQYNQKQADESFKLKTYYGNPANLSTKGGHVYFQDLNYSNN